MKFILTLIATLILPLSANAAAVIGEAAPDFTATDVLSGEDIALSDLKGKTVVMEWTNPGCPFVQKHYETDNMQALQEKYTAQDVVWITVNSSAEGKQGHLSAEEAQNWVTEQNASPSYYVLDASGDIGQSYEAKSTPHMYVIDSEGVLRYEGAIDDDSSPRHSAVADAENYVASALDALAAGEEIEVKSSQAYGWAGKY